MRFAGIPQRPKPPIRMEAPSGTSATAASALASTLFMVAWIRLCRRPSSQLRPPAAGVFKDVRQAIATFEVVAEILENRNERIECRTNLVRIRHCDIAPNLGRARRQSRRVDEPSPCQIQTILANGFADHMHECTSGELRKRTQEGQDPIVGRDV